LRCRNRRNKKNGHVGNGRWRDPRTKKVLGKRGCVQRDGVWTLRNEGILGEGADIEDGRAVQSARGWSRPGMKDLMGRFVARER